MYVLLIFFIGRNGVYAQKYLQIEKRGNPKTEKIKLYEQLTFQLRDNEKIWYTRQILGLDANAQLIQLGDSWLPLSDVTRIKLHRERGWVNILGTALQAGGASMILTDAWFSARNEPQYSQGGWEFGLINLAVGTGLKWALAPIYYRLDGRHRLRIVDLTF
jgi:hypothetical protein